MDLTKPQRKALEILRDHGPLRAGAFAAIMWPDSPGWSSVTKCGPNGSTSGGGMNLAGGAYLGKLRRKGLTNRFGDRLDRHRISPEGLEMLKKAEHLPKV